MNHRPLRATLLVIWLFAVAAVYFWAHKPFDAAVVAGIGHLPLALTAWLWPTGPGAAMGYAACGHLPAGDSLRPVSGWGDPYVLYE